MKRDLFAKIARRRLAAERGRIDKEAPFTVALCYPSPYRVGMSSLGYLSIYRAIQNESAMACERVFLADDADTGPLAVRPLSLERLRPLDDFPVLAFSVAYELEIAGLVQMLEAAGIPSLREQRTGAHPLIIVGGPLTFSNPLPLAPFVDAVVMGEADSLAIDVLREIRDSDDRSGALAALARLAHVFVPDHHGDELPPIAMCAHELLPAWSPIRTPDTELSDMFLIETERGCSRGCTYCVMRRTTNGGMRVVDADRVLGLVPEDATRVGLVGAAVSDHPQIVPIVRSLVERGCEVGLSSLRPDRLSDDFVGALKAGGYRTLTTAMDGSSNRVREILDRRARTKHLVRAAELARKHRIARLKLYLMIGVPGEHEGDIDECVQFVQELSRLVPVSLTVGPFCAKRNTPLDGQPFAGIRRVNELLARLRRGLRGRADVRAASVRWAWVEYVLAQGGVPEGLALRRAVLDGGRFANYKRAFAEREQQTVRRKLNVVRPEAASGPRVQRWLEPEKQPHGDGG